MVSVMSKWKLATVLLGAGFAASIVSMMAAAQLWEFVYPRSAFLNAACFFAFSAMSFLAVVLFLDDLSGWIKGMSSSVLRTLFSLFFTLAFTILMVSGLYFGMIAGNALKPLSVCTFNTLDTLCTKKQSELTEEELGKIKRSFHYHLTYKNHPLLTNIVQKPANEL